MNYSKLIKKLREKLVVSQTELAEMLGCAFASVNRWEQGYHEPTMKAKKKIAAICNDLNIEMEDL